MINDSEFILITFYNTNTENEEHKTYIDLNDLPLYLDLSENKHTIFPSDFDLIFANLLMQKDVLNFKKDC